MHNFSYLLHTSLWCDELWGHSFEQISNLNLNFRARHHYDNSIEFLSWFLSEREIPDGILIFHVLDSVSNNQAKAKLRLGDCSSIDSGFFGDSKESLDASFSGLELSNDCMTDFGASHVLKCKSKSVKEIWIMLCVITSESLILRTRLLEKEVKNLSWIKNRNNFE